MSADPAVRHVRRLAANNRLANRRLLGACALLAPGEWEAARIGFFPSLVATLNHVLTVDWFYVDALEGGTLGPAAWADEVPCPTVAELAREQDAVDVRLIAVCARLTAADLSAPVRMHRGTRIVEDRCDDLLDHLFQHQTHHRGQAHAMLAGTSVRPPQLDEFLMAGDAPRRADDLAALGWREPTGGT